MRTPSHAFKVSTRCAALAACVALGFPSAHGQQQGAGVRGSLGDVRDSAGAVADELVAAQRRIRDLEVALMESEGKNAVLAEALAISGRESEHFRVAYQRLRGQIEALGLAAVDGSHEAVRARLVDAANDLRLAAQERDAIAEVLRELVEVGAEVDAAIPVEDEALRPRLHAALERAGDALGYSDGSSHRGGNTSEARVVSVKEDYGLVVLDIGTAQGVRAGMPLEIFRRDRPVATAMVVEARDAICGAVIGQLLDPGDFVRAGDGARMGGGGR